MNYAEARQVSLMQDIYYLPTLIISSTGAQENGEGP